MAGARAYIVGPMPTGSRQPIHHLDGGYQLQQIHQGVTTPAVNGQRHALLLQEAASHAYASWLTACLRSMQAAHGDCLPFPMNHWVPWRTRQAMAEHFRAHSAEQV